MSCILVAGLRGGYNICVLEKTDRVKTNIAIIRNKKENKLKVPCFSSGLIKAPGWDGMGCMRDNIKAARSR